MPAKQPTSQPEVRSLAQITAHPADQHKDLLKAVLRHIRNTLDEMIEKHVFNAAPPPPPPEVTAGRLNDLAYESLQEVARAISLVHMVGEAAGEDGHVRTSMEGIEGILSHASSLLSDLEWELHDFHPSAREARP